MSLHLLAVAAASNWNFPSEMLLHAPFTPFTANGTLNATDDIVSRLAKQARAFGVTTIFVGGSMGEFDAMTFAERKALTTAWVKAAKPLGLYVISHCGTQGSLSDAIDMAQHAAAVGADAIASVPPFYERPQTVLALLDYLSQLASGAPKLPLIYYHIPSHTGVTFKMMDLFDGAAALGNDGSPRLPTLAGVKYVDTDFADWFALTRKYNDTKALLFAPEPKLTSFALGVGRGVVLAEDFFAPTYAKMKAAFDTHDLGMAHDEQEWKLKAMQALKRYGGGSAERVLYRRLCANVDLGPPRPPKVRMPEADWPCLQSDLAKLGFWSQMEVLCKRGFH